jgi:hypothetical protein
MHERESVERLRRIETRVTKIGQAMGVDVGGGRPIWMGHMKRVVIPSPNCSVGAVVAAVPLEYHKDEIDVYCGEDYKFTLFMDEH